MVEFLRGFAPGAAQGFQQLPQAVGFRAERDLKRQLSADDLGQRRTEREEDRPGREADVALRGAQTDAARAGILTPEERGLELQGKRADIRLKGAQEGSILAGTLTPKEIAAREQSATAGATIQNVAAQYADARARGDIAQTQATIRSSLANARYTDAKRWLDPVQFAAEQGTRKRSLDLQERAQASQEQQFGQSFLRQIGQDASANARTLLDMQRDEHRFAAGIAAQAGASRQEFIYQIKGAYTQNALQTNQPVNEAQITAIAENLAGPIQSGVSIAAFGLAAASNGDEASGVALQATLAMQGVNAALNAASRGQITPEDARQRIEAINGQLFESMKSFVRAPAPVQQAAAPAGTPSQDFTQTEPQTSATGKADLLAMPGLDDSDKAAIKRVTTLSKSKTPEDLVAALNRVQKGHWSLAQGRVVRLPWSHEIGIKASAVLDRLSEGNLHLGRPTSDPRLLDAGAGKAMTYEGVWRSAVAHADESGVTEADDPASAETAKKVLRWFTPIFAEGRNP